MAKLIQNERRLICSLVNAGALVEGGRREVEGGRREETVKVKMNEVRKVAEDRICPMVEARVGS